MSENLQETTAKNITPELPNTNNLSKQIDAQTAQIKSVDSIITNYSEQVKKISNVQRNLKTLEDSNLKSLNTSLNNTKLTTPTPNISKVVNNTVSGAIDNANANTNKVVNNTDNISKVVNNTDNISNISASLDSFRTNIEAIIPSLRDTINIINNTELPEINQVAKSIVKSPLEVKKVESEKTESNNEQIDVQAAVSSPLKDVQAITSPPQDTTASSQDTTASSQDVQIIASPFLHSLTQSMGEINNISKTLMESPLNNPEFVNSAITINKGLPVFNQLLTSMIIYLGDIVDKINKIPEEEKINIQFLTNIISVIDESFKIIKSLEKIRNGKIKKSISKVENIFNMLINSLTMMEKLNDRVKDMNLSTVMVQGIGEDEVDTEGNPTGKKKVGEQLKIVYLVGKVKNILDTVNILFKSPLNSKDFEKNSQKIFKNLPKFESLMSDVLHKISVMASNIQGNPEDMQRLEHIAKPFEIIDILMKLITQKLGIKQIISIKIKVGVMINIIKNIYLDMVNTFKDIEENSLTKIKTSTELFIESLKSIDNLKKRCESYLEKKNTRKWLKVQNRMRIVLGRVFNIYTMLTNLTKSIKSFKEIRQKLGYTIETFEEIMKTVGSINQKVIDNFRGNIKLFNKTIDGLFLLSSKVLIIRMLMVNNFTGTFDKIFSLINLSKDMVDKFNELGSVNLNTPNLISLELLIDNLIVITGKYIKLSLILRIVSVKDEDDNKLLRLVNLLISISKSIRLLSEELSNIKNLNTLKISMSNIMKSLEVLVSGFVLISLMSILIIKPKKTTEKLVDLVIGLILVLDELKNINNEDSVEKLKNISSALIGAIWKLTLFSLITVLSFPLLWLGMQMFKLIMQPIISVLEMIDKLDDKKIKESSKALMLIAGAFALFTLSIALISLIVIEPSIWIGMGLLIVMITSAVIVMFLINKLDKDITSGTKALMLIAGAFALFTITIVLIQQVIVTMNVAAGMLALIGIIAIGVGVMWLLGQKFLQKDVLSGAKTLLFISGSFILFTISIILLSEVNASTDLLAVMGMLTLVIGVAVLLMMMLKKASKEVLKGIIVILAISITMIITAFLLNIASQQFDNTSWMGLIFGMTSIVVIAALYGVIGYFFSFIAFGALALLTLGISLIITAILINEASQQFDNTSWEGLIFGMTSILIISTLYGVIGCFISPFIIAGSISIFLLAVSLFVVSLSINKASHQFDEVSWEGLIFGMKSLLTVAGCFGLIGLPPIAICVALGSVVLLLVAKAISEIGESMDLVNSLNLDPKKLDKNFKSIGNGLTSFIDNMPGLIELGIVALKIPMILGLSWTISSIANTIKEVADLKIATDWDSEGKATSWRSLSDKDFESAGKNTATIITTLFNAIINVYKQLSEEDPSVFDTGFLGFGQGPLAKIINLSSKLSEVIANIAYGVAQMATLQVADKWDSKGKPISFRSLRDSDFKLAGEGTGKVITSIFEAIVGIVKPNEYGKNFNTDIVALLNDGGLFGKSTIAKIIGLSADLGGIIANTAEGVIKMAQGTFEDPETGETRRVGTTEYEKAGINIKSVVTVIFESLSALAATPEMKPFLKDNWFTTSPAGVMFGCIDKISGLIQPLAENVANFAQNKFVVDGNVVEIEEGGYEKAGKNIGKLISSVITGIQGATDVEAAENTQEILEKIDLNTLVDNLLNPILSLKDAEGKFVDLNTTTVFDNIGSNVNQIILSLSSMFDNVGFSNFTNVLSIQTDLEKIDIKDLIDNLSSQINIDQKTLESIENTNVSEVISSIFSNLNKNIKVTEITKTKELFKSIKELGFNDTINSIISPILKLNDNTTISNYKDMVDATGYMIKHVNSVDVQKISKVTDLIEKIAKLSESISGNFDKLGEVIGENLLDAINELNEVLDKTNKLGDFSVSNNQVNKNTGNVTSSTMDGSQIKQSNPMQTNNKDNIQVVNAISSVIDAINNLTTDTFKVKITNVSDFEDNL